MTPEERVRLDRIINTVLDAVAREAGKSREWLSLEIEQVVGGGIFEAYRVGSDGRTARRRSSATIPVITTNAEEGDDG